jgi:hypothetical protein
MSQLRSVEFIDSARGTAMLSSTSVSLPIRLLPNQPDHVTPIVCDMRMVSSTSPLQSNCDCWLQGLRERGDIDCAAGNVRQLDPARR